jgi:hypothetical protein
MNDILTIKNNISRDIFGGMNDILTIKNNISRDIFDYQQLMLCLSSYSKPRDRIRTLIKNNQIVRIKKGLYIFGEGFQQRSFVPVIVFFLFFMFEIL